MHKAWNGWYHVNGNTYGTWLRGDQRGWRSRWHREHVEGDYKNPPPPGTYEAELAQSRASLKKPPVHLTLPQRQIAGRAMMERLLEMQIELLALSVGAAHYHLLGRFPNAQVRWPVGRAKKHASHLLTGVGLEGSVWGKKCRALPVKDRAHQLNVFEYICNHAAEGAWVWDFRQGIYWK